MHAGHSTHVQQNVTLLHPFVPSTPMNRSEQQTESSSSFDSFPDGQWQTTGKRAENRCTFVYPVYRDVTVVLRIAGSLIFANTPNDRTE
jgi:hypothetical protein